MAFNVRTLLIDETTNSLSLSKLQIVAWTVAIFVGYVYLTLCYVMVQARFSVPSVPNSMLAFLGISGATALTNVAITNIKGSPGSDGMKPRFADLFTHGGVVVVERVQYFAFTLLALLYFLGAMLSYDPGSITGLPDVPDTLWQLAGLSALGYLGGRTIRAPGPVITTAKVDQAANKIVLTGSGLSPQATVTVLADKPAGPSCSRKSCRRSPARRRRNSRTRSPSTCPIWRRSKPPPVPSFW